MKNNEDILPAFFCVPDITGFTQFIANTDISFSKTFIPGLLRRLINANIIKMSVGEIEGDAIFFYRTGRLPSIKHVSKQCQFLFETFYSYLSSIKNEDADNYEKYLSNNKLGLKIIIHFGHISAANIKGRTKLIGEDVIITHKLLKNSIQEYEYILLTENYLNKIRKKDVSSWFHWNELKTGMDEYEHIGKINYSYITCSREENEAA